MPLFEFKCDDCKIKREHFIYAGAPIEKICPRCSSKNYRRQFSTFRSAIEYSDSNEHMERVITPGVNEIYSKIGREALDHDAGTLESVFGSDNIKQTLAETDD